MVYLTDRQQIAKAMNFGKYPVLYINRETPKQGYDGLYEGDAVKTATPSSNYPDSHERGNLIFADGKYEITGIGSCLHSDFGRSDVLESYQWAKAQTVHRGDHVVIVEDYPKIGMVKVHVMRVSHVTKFCQTAATLKEVDEFDP